MKQKLNLIFTFVFTVLPLVACTFSVDVAPTVMPSPTAAVGGAELCPAETAQAKLLRNDAEGYCFLYPADFVVVPPRFVVINPITAPGDQPGDAWVDVSVVAGNGRTAEEFVADEIAAAGVGFEIHQEQRTVDYTIATVVDGLPGPDSMRKVFVISYDRLYTFTFMPWGQNAELPALYESIMKTLRFLPPSAPLQ